MFLLCWLLVSPQPSWADWICEGDRLSVEVTQGAVDLTGLTQGIPNTSEGTLPGDGVVLRWRDLELQLPRTNNAGSPSYTDGRWWWRVVDASAPEFWERRGSVIRHQCELIWACILLPPFSFAAVGLAGSSVAIAGFVSKLGPAGWAHQDPVGLAVGADPELHVPRLSAVIATISPVFPQFFSRPLWRIGVLRLPLRICCFVHSRERVNAT